MPEGGVARVSALDLFSPELRAALEQWVDDRVAAALADNGRYRDAWPEWMRLPRAAEYIDVSEDALRKLAERGKVTYSQEAPGCALWFARSDLDAFMLDQRREARSS